mmetsp:Transcript_23596/g.76258  ORF Transcript_23596/g.76258 Transcript_23596/m.76258 type:complete len:212 (+) Transcript_23596:1519-2154(+)
MCRLAEMEAAAVRRELGRHGVRQAVGAPERCRQEGVPLGRQRAGRGRVGSDRVVRAPHVERDGARVAHLKRAVEGAHVRVRSVGGSANHVRRVEHTAHLALQCGQHGLHMLQHHARWLEHRHAKKSGCVSAVPRIVRERRRRAGVASRQLAELGQPHRARRQHRHQAVHKRLQHFRWHLLHRCGQHRHAARVDGLVQWCLGSPQLGNGVRP